MGSFYGGGGGGCCPTNISFNDIYNKPIDNLTATSSGTYNVLAEQGAGVYVVSGYYKIDETGETIDTNGNKMGVLVNVDSATNKKYIQYIEILNGHPYLTIHTLENDLVIDTLRKDLTESSGGGSDEGEEWGYF